MKICIILYNKFAEMMDLKNCSFKFVVAANHQKRKEESFLRLTAAFLENPTSLVIVDQTLFFPLFVGSKDRNKDIQTPLLSSYQQQNEIQINIYSLELLYHATAFRSISKTSCSFPLIYDSIS